MYHQVEQNFSATAHLTQIILWYGKLYCICKMSYIQQSRLYPLDTYSTPTPDIQQWLQTLPNVSWGKNHPQLRNSGLDVAIHYGKKKNQCSSIIYQYFSVAESCLTLCDTMDWGTSDSTVLHYLPECAQIYVHWVGDAV